MTNKTEHIWNRIKIINEDIITLQKKKDETKNIFIKLKITRYTHKLLDAIEVYKEMI